MSDRKNDTEIIQLRHERKNLTQTPTVPVPVPSLLLSTPTRSCVKGLCRLFAPTSSVALGILLILGGWMYDDEAVDDILHSFAEQIPVTMAAPLS